jgi:hypothetical protein
MSQTLTIETQGNTKIVAATSENAVIAADVYQEPPPATLDAHLAASLDGYAAAGGTLPVFSSVTQGTSYTRSATCWLRALDWTGVSPWNSTGESERGGTAISPRHIVFANHFPIANGATVKFVTANNTIVERTLVNQQQIGSTDIRVGLLNSDLPPTIKFYKLLPDYLFESIFDAFVPCVSFDKIQQVTARRNKGSTMAAYTTGSLLSFTGTTQVGDSGQPSFWILYNEPVLLGTWFTSVAIDPLRQSIAAINSAMSSLGGGYQAVTYDISDKFPFYGDF